MSSFVQTPSGAAHMPRPFSVPATLPARSGKSARIHHSHDGFADSSRTVHTIRHAIVYMPGPVVPDLASIDQIVLGSHRITNTA